MERATVLAQSKPVRNESIYSTHGGKTQRRRSLARVKIAKLQIGLLLAEICYVSRRMKHRCNYRSIK